MFRLFLKKQKPWLSTIDEKSIIDSIKSAEKKTSGEIRLFIESHNPYMNVVHRAEEIFFQLKMQKTQHSNSVLMYIAFKDKEISLFGDQGIFEKRTSNDWQELVYSICKDFEQRLFTDGIVSGIQKIGEWLGQEFPYHSETDKNELPDNIVFGK